MPLGIKKREEKTFFCCITFLSGNAIISQMCFSDIWRILLKICANLSWKPNMCRSLLISNLSLSRWTTKGAIFSMWLCRIQTLKVSCSSSVLKLTSTPGFRMLPNSPLSTWLSRPDLRSLSATWWAPQISCHYYSCSIQTKVNKKRNAAVLHLFSSFISPSAACRSQS